MARIDEIKEFKGFVMSAFEIALMLGMATLAYITYEAVTFETK